MTEVTTAEKCRIYHPVLSVMTGATRAPTQVPSLAYASHYKDFQPAEFNPERPLHRLPGVRYQVSYTVKHVPGAIPCTVIRSLMFPLCVAAAQAPVQAELPEEFRAFARKWDDWFEENTRHHVTRLEYDPEGGEGGGGALTLFLSAVPGVSPPKESQK